MKKIFLIAAIFIMVIALILGGCAKPAPSEAKTLKIGNLGTVTGPASDNLKLFVWGGEVAKDYINSKGGITVNGQKYMVETIVYDCPIMSADAAVTAAERLVYEDKVKFVTGNPPPHLARAVASVTEPNGVLYAQIYNSAGPQEGYGPDGKFLFLANNGMMEMFVTSMSYLKELHPEVKTLVHTMADDGQIPDIEPKLKKLASGLGITVVGNIIGFSNETVDFAPITQKCLATGADAIMVGNGPTTSSSGILRVAREMGYTKPIFGTNINPAPEILELTGKAAATNYFIHTVTPDTPDMPAITKEVAELAVAKYGRFELCMSFGFNGVYTMVQAIEKAQSFDPAVVRDTWEKMDTIEVIFGTGKMGGMENYGIRRTVYSPQPIWRLEKGELLFGKWQEVYMP